VCVARVRGGAEWGVCWNEYVIGVMHLVEGAAMPPLWPRVASAARLPLAAARKCSTWKGSTMYKHSKYCTVNDVLYRGLGMLCRGDAAGSICTFHIHALQLAVVGLSPVVSGCAAGHQEGVTC
jgi:hypothetical protein